MKRNWLSYMCMAALFSGALTSCNESSFLNLSDPNYFTESNFWKDKADAESALAAAYSPIKGAMYGYFGAFDGWLNLNGRGDDIYTIKGEEVPMWNIANFLALPWPGSATSHLRFLHPPTYWKLLIRSLIFCNITIFLPMTLKAKKMRNAVWRS